MYKFTHILTTLTHTHMSLVFVSHPIRVVDPTMCTIKKK